MISRFYDGTSNRVFSKVNEEIIWLDDDTTYALFPSNNKIIECNHGLYETHTNFKIYNIIGHNNSNLLREENIEFAFESSIYDISQINIVDDSTVTFFATRDSQKETVILKLVEDKWVIKPEIDWVEE